MIDAIDSWRTGSDRTLGLLTDFAVIAGYSVINETIPPGADVRATQRECVVWFNGQALDHEPDPDAFSADDGGNAFPSDEDEPAPYDAAMQDYDFDRDVDDRSPEWSGVGDTNGTSYRTGAFAVAVEKGDCDPALGTGFRYRGHLDFMDPNGLYHEVQEYDHECSLDLPYERPLCFAEDGTAACGPETTTGYQTGIAPLVTQLFPWTYTDPHNKNGACRRQGGQGPSVTPGTGGPMDVVNNTTVSPGYIDLGHKCNGTIQDLFKERMWITQVHDPTYDPTIAEHYTFALQVDTCSGMNAYELNGKTTDKGINDSSRAPNAMGDIFRGGQRSLDSVVESRLDPVRPYLGGNGTDVVRTYVDVCTDGSSYSFDDTFRGRTVHGKAPVTTEGIMRGNSFDNTTLKHREVCRDRDIRWPHNQHPPGTSQVTCYSEDHKTALADLYVYQTDPTGGHWAIHTKGWGATGTSVWTVPPPGHP